MMNPTALPIDSRAPRVRCQRTRRVSLALAGAAAVLCLGAGCNILGPALFILEGPPTKDAVAKLEGNRTTVIFIDDRDSRLPKRSLRSDIARIAEQTLLDKGIVAEGNIIAASSAMRAAAGESDDSPLAIVDIGREVGAEVIVYAKVVAFTLSRDGVSMSPAANLDVRIIDTVSNSRLWPESDAGYPLTIILPATQGQVFGMSLAERSAAERQLAQTIGLRIAQLFYETSRDSTLGT
jgi:hypothetical protein